MGVPMMLLIMVRVWEVVLSELMMLCLGSTNTRKRAELGRRQQRDEMIGRQSIEVAGGAYVAIVEKLNVLSLPGCLLIYVGISMAFHGIYTSYASAMFFMSRIETCRCSAGYTSRLCVRCQISS